MSPEQLFPPPGREFLALLAGLPRHLDAAMPMRRQHRTSLPADIRELSHLLTDERGDLRRDYLADPAALSAYLRYFLPWNLYRLGVLFGGLDLDLPDGTTVVDLGAGPLTGAIALWLSRPKLRGRALTFVCVDRAAKPMRLGLDILESLAAKHGGPEGLKPWRVTLVKGSLDTRLREKAGLLLMANALNEVLRRGQGELLEEAEELARHLGGMLAPNGQLLLVEPGVRPSAHLIAALRRGLLHLGLKPLAPCPHTGPCPMSGRGYTAWCHFNFDAAPAPAWLRALSDQARLPKDNVSLSLLQMSTAGSPRQAAPGKSLVRAVSGPFALPAQEGPPRFGQYACSERGLTLLSLPRKQLVPLPGALIEAAWPEAPEQDAKSGALVLPLGLRPQEDGPAAPAPPARTPKPPRLPSQRPRERAQGGAPKPAPRAAADARPESGATARPAPGSGPKARGRNPSGTKKDRKGRADR